MIQWYLVRIGDIVDIDAIDDIDDIGDIDDIEILMILMILMTQWYLVRIDDDLGKTDGGVVALHKKTFLHWNLPTRLLQTIDSLLFF